ncbi:MAG: VOC family protein [Rubripirellula sp.]
MEPRISMVTLGVADLQKSIDFYEQVVGWQAMEKLPTIAFFDLRGLAFSLYPHSEMVKEWNATLDDIPTYRGFALAHNVASAEQVDAIFARLESKGCDIVKPPEKVFWGGYSGYFADPDGNKWEVAHNPFWVMREDGRIVMKKA